MTRLIQPVVCWYIMWTWADTAGGCGADTAGCIYEHVPVYGYMCMYTGGAISLCMCMDICIGAVICVGIWIDTNTCSNGLADCTALQALYFA